MDSVLYNIDVPKSCIDALEKNKKRSVALLLYPMIQDGELCLEQVATLLDMSRIDLLFYYGSLGLSVFTLTEDEINEDVDTLTEFFGGMK